MRLFWIEPPLRLAVTTRPRGGGALFVDLATLRAEGVDLLVSMLTPIEAGALGLLEEGRSAEALGMEFISAPVEDHSVPRSMASFGETVRRGAKALESGRALAVHCYAGLGRSPLFAASLLVLLGVEPAEALDRLSRARGIAVPETAEQRRWVHSFALTMGAAQRPPTPSNDDRPPEC